MTEKTNREPAKSSGPTRSVWMEALDLIARLEGSSVQRLSIQDGDLRVEIERGVPAVAAGLPASPGVPAAATEVEHVAVTDNRHPVLAPLVGAFYRSPQPGAEPFVKEGDVVDPGQPVAIVEAMKIMNQIVADRRGRVGEILLKDGDWVEFEQVLMYLDPFEG